MSTAWDVIVVGGGPAGAACANLLATAGHQVVVLEAASFPRFSLGESLLPSALPLLHRLGFDLGEHGYLRKDGAEFFDEALGEYELYDFADALPGGPRFAYQVERAPFDHALLTLARSAGATVCEGVRITRVALGEAGVTAKSDDGTWRGRYLVDATGRGCILGRSLRSIEPLHALGRACVFAHFRDLAAPAWAELSSTGNVKVLRVPDGWLWAIPLAGERLSVGLVTTRGKLEPALLHQAIAASPLLRRLTATASRTPVGLTGDWSYRNQRSFGPRWATIGDAAGFLDPVFSSGVALALEAGSHLADRLDSALEQGEEAQADLMEPLAAHMRHGYRCFHTLIYRFYQKAMFDNLLLAGDPDPEMRAGLITMLAGDVWRDDNRFQNLVMNSRSVAPQDGWG
jgi:flavin-dependent dehydrogenase